MWRFFLGLPIDLWVLLLRCVWWAIVPPGVSGHDFPRGHFLLRAAAFAPVWWWLVREQYDSLAVAVFCTACAAAVFSLVTLTASAMTADALGRT